MPDDCNSPITAPGHLRLRGGFDDFVVSDPFGTGLVYSSVRQEDTSVNKSCYLELRPKATARMAGDDEDPCVSPPSPASVE